MNWDRVLDIVINKVHMVVACIYGGGLAVYSLKTGHDLGPGLVNATYAFYGFLAGHALTYQKWPDKDDKDKDSDGAKDAAGQ
jgi:hypothetical protein